MKQGFSLIEILIVLIIVSIILSVSMPIITKKLTSNAININNQKSNIEFSSDCTQWEDCTLCLQDKCALCSKPYSEGKYIKISDCSYQDCETTIENCASCNAQGKKCKKCLLGYQLKDETQCALCEEEYYCDGTTTKITCDQKWEHCEKCNGNECTLCENEYKISEGECIPEFECSGENFLQVGSLCITKKNMGDDSELEITPSITIAAASSQTCTETLCCFNGTTSSSCNADNGGYSGCTRTVCKWDAAVQICSSFSPNGKTWRLPTSSEITSFYDISKNRGTDGLMICAYSANLGFAQCRSSNYCLGATDGYACNTFDIWTSESINSESAINYSLNDGGFEQFSGLKQTPRSVRCVTEL